MKKLIFFLVLNLFGCGSSYEEAIINEKSNNPDQESWGVTIILTDSSIERAKQTSKYIPRTDIEKKIKPNVISILPIL